MENLTAYYFIIRVYSDEANDVLAALSLKKKRPKIGYQQRIDICTSSVRFQPVTFYLQAAPRLMRSLGVAKSDVGYTKIRYTSGTERITKFSKLHGYSRTAVQLYRYVRTAETGFEHGFE